MSKDNSAGFNELDRLLDEERRILLAGELSSLAELLPHKEALVAELETESLKDREQLDGLNEKLRRNQLLLDGALQGIRSVAQRLAALRRVRSSLETYDSMGRKKTIEMSKDGKIEKRA